MRGSYPVTRQSGTCSVHELAGTGRGSRGVRSGRLARTFRVHSSWISSVQRAWNRSVRASRMSKVAERGRVQDAGVVEDDWGHGSVAHVEVLAQRREFVEGRVTLGLEIPLVGEQVFQQHPPVGPHLPARDGPLVEELHQVRPGDVQEVGRLLGRQLGTDRRQGHRVPLPQLGQDLHEQPQGRGREDQLLARRCRSSPPGGARRRRPGGPRASGPIPWRGPHRPRSA